MLVKPYVPSDKLEGSSVVNSVIDKLFVECLMVCLCLFPSMVFVWQCPFLVKEMYLVVHRSFNM